MIIERCKRGHDASWRTEKLWRADFGCMACDAEDARAQRDELNAEFELMREDRDELLRERDELLADMRELLATCNDHSSYLALDSLAALRMTIRALREKWGEK